MIDDRKMKRDASRMMSHYHLPRALALLAILSATPASANDGSYFASGNQLIPLQETDISVKKEVLTIKRINDDKVRVTVDYTFHNPTKEKTLLMGFEAKSPEGDVDDKPHIGRHPYIENFSVNFNDKAISHKVSTLSLPFEEIGKNKKSYKTEDLNNQKSVTHVGTTGQSDIFYVYHFPATFAPGNTRVIHTYDYAISGAVLTTTAIDYMLTPALRWANKQIDDFTLIIDLGEFQQYHIYPTFFDNLDQWETKGRVKIGMENVKNAMSDETKNMMTVWQHQGSVTFHAKNFRPQGELDLFANRFIPDYEILDSKTLKISLQEYPWLHDEMELKDEFTRKVLENLPYARRGYVFKNKQLKAFYEKQPWYMPDPDYKHHSLTEEEKTWLKEVRALKVAN